MASKHVNRKKACFVWRIVLSAALATTVPLFCAGCLVIPIRTQAPARGASTETHEQVNLEFIEKGVTTRAEIAQKLAWMDTGVKEDRLFIGRWFDSGWGVAWMAVSYYSFDSGWNRKWNNHDLLIEFDSAGIVQQYRVLPDKQLAVELSAWAAQAHDHPLDLSTPIEVHANVDTQYKSSAFSDQFLLGSDSFERRELQGKGKHNFAIPPSQVTSLSLSPLIPDRGSVHGPGPDPQRVCLTFHFAQKTRAGRKLTIQSDMPTVVLVFKYFAQTHRPQC